MHMSDALISPEVGGAFYLVAGGLVAWSLKKLTGDDQSAERLPLSGVLGAFVFSAQMINFAIPGTGSSGHIGGGLLLAVMLGPYTSMLVMASILLVQCLLFADGGLLALGCNIFNLGFWPAFVGLPLYLSICRLGNGRRIFETAAVIIAVIVSLEAGAMGVVVQTWLSGRSELPFSFFALFMMGIHIPIAVVEGVMSSAVLVLLERAAPGNWKASLSPMFFSKRACVLILTVAVLTGVIGVWFASSKPDGLEWSISRVTGSENLELREGPIQQMSGKIQKKTAILPDYTLPGSSETEVLESQAGAGAARWFQPDVGTSLSGLAGGIATALLVVLIGIVPLKTGRPRNGADA